MLVNFGRIVFVLLTAYTLQIHTAEFRKVNTTCAYGCRCSFLRKGELKAMCSSSFLPRKGKVTFIPKLPPNVTIVSLSSCTFPNVTKQLLKNLASLKLGGLLFHHTATKRVGKDAFSDLSHLEQLEFGRNIQLLPDMVKKSMNGLRKAVIKTLRFEFNEWSNLPTHMFEDLSGSNLSVISLKAAFVVGVLYKARWHIRYGIYLLRAKRSGYDRIPGNDGDYEYDAFVIYSEENRDFVHQRLIPKIEKENGYRLCIHYRDFDVGRLIADNIIESINKSRHVIAVLSNSFARSEWCHFDLRVSQKRYLDTDSDMLILVMLEEINNRHLSSSLKSLITMTKYAVWTEEEVGQTQFWDQLLNALSYQ